jgi:cytochrome P450 family 6
MFGLFAIETLRMYPPAPALIREVTTDYTLPGTDTVLEKGTTVFVSLYGLHHDPTYFPEPEKFDPQRFSPPVKAQRDHFAYMPFGEGPRQCIGKKKTRWTRGKYP